MSAPQLNAVVQGVGVVNADNLNTYVQWCSTAAQLRAFIGLPGMTVFMQGISAPNDGGQGLFEWLASVSQPDDNENYIIPSAASGGGWVRFGPTLPVPVITGALSAVSDANAKAVLTSIISALVTMKIATSGTT